MKNPFKTKRRPEPLLLNFFKKRKRTLYGEEIDQFSCFSKLAIPRRQPDLTTKERIYVNARTTPKKYIELKQAALGAADQRKVFTVHGGTITVRNALTQRGWVEKLPKTYNYLSKIKKDKKAVSSEWQKKELEKVIISDSLKNQKPYFIWETKDTKRRSFKYPVEFGTKVNVLKMNTTWTSKEGLCSVSKNLQWFQREGEAEAKMPRTYKSLDADELAEFIDDYRLTACTSLLKWYVEKKKTDPKFDTVDNMELVPIKTYAFAINRCKEYIQYKEHMFLDESLRATTKSAWNTYLKYYYRLIGGNARFETDTDRKLPLYTAYAEVVLETIQKYRPQMKCEGYRNLWILKPSDASRGYGIRIGSKLKVLKKLFAETQMKYIMQKYIEEPLLIYETKFDIRQYFLVTQTIPLILWMYKQSYLKFSSQKYNLDDFDESIHLTNNAVQKKYKNAAVRDKRLPANNMWTCEQFQDYLAENGAPDIWERTIYPGMKRTIIAVMLASQDSMIPSQGQFEMFGCDFVLDCEYNPWLIEINAFPDMHATTSVTADLCPAVHEDIIKVVVDHAENAANPTGNFECIYRQPNTKLVSFANLTVSGFALKNPYKFSNIGDSSLNMDIDDSNIIDVLKAVRLRMD